MKSMFLTGLMLMVVACSGGQTSGGEGKGENQAELKRQAASSPGNSSSDVCAANDWYGDKVCDTFCPDLDVDCSLGGDDVVCLTYIEEANGKCDRDPGSPCIQQDPDCVGTIEPTPGEPIACAAVVRLADGVCEPDPNDPCVAYQDEDCWHNGTPSDPGPGDGDGRCGTPDPEPPVACAAYIEESDGVCGREPNDPCIGQDPDCSVK